jgi:hypothetical protein
MEWKLSFLIEMVPHLTLGGGFPSCSFSLKEFARACGTRGPAGKDNIAILQLKWLSGKMKNLATFEPYAHI